MKRLLIFFAVVLVSGCAYQPVRQGGMDLPKEPNYEETEGAQTGLPTWAAGSRFTSAQGNTIDDFLEAHETRLDTIEAVNGIIEGVGDGTYTAIDTSAEVYAAISDETGSASGSPLLMFNQNPTINGMTVSGTVTDSSATWPTWNQNTTGTAAGITGDLDPDQLTGDSTDNNLIDGNILSPFTAQTLAVPASGDGDPAPGTVTFTSSVSPASIVINCQDGDGCPMTMSESGAVDGMRLRIFSSSSSAGDMTFATSAGVQSLRSGRTLEPGESVEFEYRTDYWDEIGDSTEPVVSAPGNDGDYIINNAGDFGAVTIDTLSQAEAENDASTAAGFVTGERLGQAIVAWLTTYRGTEDSPRTSEPAQADLYLGLTVWADGDQWQPAGVAGVHEVQCIELGNPATWIALRSAGGDVYLDVPRYVKASSTLNDTTSPHALTDGEMLNHTISNYGDSADQTYSIPVYSTAVGWDVEFFMGAAYDMIIAPSGSANWYLDGVARTAGQYITNASPAVGESVACKDKYGIIWCTSTGTGWAWETGLTCDVDSDSQVFAFATLDSNQTTIDDGGNWRGEAFTLGSAYDLTGFQIYAVDLSSDTGTITCELKAYNTGTNEPTGSVLATTGALASSTMPNTSQQFFFPFTAVYSASATDYCVYCYGTSGGTIGIRRVSTSTEDVANAKYIYSYDSGSTWGTSGYDVRGDGVFGCAP